jgi:2-keto-3-deoxy-L-rhamnonate aldolase RhmA
VKGIKQRLLRGDTLLGCWLNLGSAITAEIVGLAGYDWVLIDLEHGAGSEATVLYQLQALEHTSAAAIVRVESDDRQRYHRVLDLGAEGIMCPRVNTLEDGQKAAAAIAYPPRGVRGIAKMVRACNYGATFDDYLEYAQKNLVGIIQVESEESLSHLDALASLEGIDVLFVGPADLSMSLGIFGEFQHPRFLEALKKTAEAALRHGKAAGTLLQNHEQFCQFHELGYRFLACGSDGNFLSSRAHEVFQNLDELRKKVGQ